MAVGQRLSLKQSQSLALTPGLRQSIELMQLSAGDLTQLVQRKLEENPFLERDGERGREAAAAGSADAGPEAAAEDYLGEPAGEAWGGAETEWAGDSAEAPGPTLLDHLAQQARLSFDAADLAIALALIEELDEAGYLPAALPPLPGDPDPERLERLVRRLQALGPPGLFARSLGECLALQLAERGLLDEPFRRLLDNLPLVAAGRRAQLQRLTGLDEAGLAERLARLRGLDPKPALAFTPAEVRAAIADLVVTLDAAGRASVRLNPEALPRVRLNQERRRSLRGRLRRADDKAYVTARTAEAAWLVRALARRGQSLLALGQELVARQEAFFTEGFAALRPLTRQALAEALGLSPSSVSRLVANKFLASPQGLVPLARFFTAALGEAGASAGAATARLARLVAEEPPGAPLSDRALAERLRAAGFPVARRTVAKYRAALRIPGTAQRRRRGRSLPGAPAVDSPPGRH